jgi:8-amino-7-oxononanoate synthase
MIQKIDHLPSRTIRLDGVDHLFFSGTSYLGMGHQAAFQAALIEGFRHYGTVFSASRNNNLQLKIYDEAESYLANWTGAAAALTVTSGLAAGQLAVAALPQSAVWFYAPTAHPAIWQNTPPLQRSPHGQYFFKNQQDFEQNIAAQVNAQNGAVVVACNALDPLTCIPHDFHWLTQLHDNQELTVLIDDSHGIGITGTEGGGFLKKLPFALPKNLKIVVIASLAKAVGLSGGVILGDADFIQKVRANPLFVGASPIVPAYLFAFLKCQNLYSDLLATLNERVVLFKKLLTQNTVREDSCGEGVDLNTEYRTRNNEIRSGSTQNSALKTQNCQNTEGGLFPTFRSFDNYPVFSTDDPNLYPKLLKKQIFISHFAYPRPTDPPLTRLVLSALHTEHDIEQLVAAMSDIPTF